MSEKSEKTELADTEHEKTWSIFMKVTKWSSLAVFWIVGMLIGVFGLHLPFLGPLIVLSLLVAAVFYLLR